jgi:Flp pilus assembly protein TadD
MLKLSIVLVLWAALAGCATQQSQQYVTDVVDPGREVDRLLRLYQANTAQGQSCTGDLGNDSFRECDGVLRRLAQLYTAYPDNERVNLAMAIVSYQAGKEEQARFVLDQLLANDSPRPEAAVLRARMALEAGNISRARRLLEVQARQNPMHPELHELLAAAHYADRKFPESLRSLALAERLGTPQWRTAYHRGLIFEARKNADAACEQYVSSFSLNPDFHAPQRRLIALASHPICFDLAGFILGDA